jgi:type IX secretion system PorP/SprF family membrane protein
MQLNSQHIIKTMNALVLVLFFIFAAPLHAQQDPMFTQYMFNSLAINPAYAGSRGMLSLMLLTRQQWVGFDGAPSTTTFTGHAPLFGNMAAGASVIFDKYGPVAQTSFYIDYAYHLKLTEKIKISLGLKGGVNHYSIDYNDLSKNDNVDNAYTNAVEKANLPNFGFGLYLYSQEFYVGLSIPKLIENTYEEEKESFGQGKEVRHYYGMAGVVLEGTEDLLFRPSIITRIAQGAPFNIDLNLNVILYKKIWLGAMYRLNDSFGVIMQYQFSSQFRAGYAFDLNTNELRSYHSGTHELMINYELNFNKERVINPRYF